MCTNATRLIHTINQHMQFFVVWGLHYLAHYVECSATILSCFFSVLVCETLPHKVLSQHDL